MDAGDPRGEPSGSLVHVDFRKYPDTVHWQIQMHRLGADGHGQWLWAPSGTPYRRGDEPIRYFTRLAVKLVPPTGWWTAIWNADGDPAFYVDIISPPQWHGRPTEASRVTMIDLDLDLVGHRNGEVSIVDEDEFAEHQALLSYPPYLVDGARIATARVYNNASTGVEPFGGTAAAWMERAAALAADT